MLTKTLKFDNDTLNVLKSMTWDNDGKLGKITAQLDRTLYVKVNKALEAMGGKWNRSAGGHVFSTDPRPMVEGLLDTGGLTVDHDGFFETPPDLAKRMIQLANIKFGNRCLEPSAGLGAIAKYFPDTRNLYMMEKNQQRASILLEDYPQSIVWAGDFLSVPKVQNFDRIVMNPPFEDCQDIDHVLHAYELLNLGGRIVAIMSPHAFFAQDKKSVAFREWFTGSAEDLPAGTFKSSGTNVSAKLVVIDKL